MATKPIANLQRMAKHIEMWLVDKLIPWARNPRTHSDAQVAQIAASIAEFGFNNPILVDTKEGIIAGHGRLLAARKLGLTEVPVIVLDHLTEAQKRAYVIADNKLAENAGWDDNLRGFGRYKFRHEPLFYCHVAGQKDPWYGDKTQSTLWEEKKPAANRIHPTAKPVELVERALLNSSKTGDVVADLFGGSGSTLIACERRGCRARLMEIDPKYADCIVRRFQEYSGKSAVLDGDGQTFEAVAHARKGDAS
jgi:hypothetical protein